MVDKILGKVLHKVLDKIKEIIDIEKLDDTKILINTNDKFSDDITFSCGIKDMCYYMFYIKFYLQLF